MIQIVKGIVGGQRLSFCLSKVTGRKGTQKKKTTREGKSYQRVGLKWKADDL